MTLTATPSESKIKPSKVTGEISQKNYTESVKEQVLEKLGKPNNLNFVRASNIFDNRWRVDVWCFFDSTKTIMPTKCSKIFHSYFIHTSGSGEIIKSDPKIEKEY